MYFALFRNYLPLEKGWTLHMNKLESPSPKNVLCQVWLKLAQWFWRRIWKCEMFMTTTTTTTTTTTDNGQILIRKKLTWAFGWGELKNNNIQNTRITLIGCNDTSALLTMQIWPQTYPSVGYCYVCVERQTSWINCLFLKIVNFI